MSAPPGYGQPGYPPPQQGYPPQQQGYPPQQQGYPPQQQGYPPQQQGYPPQQQGYPPQQAVSVQPGASPMPGFPPGLQFAPTVVTIPEGCPPGLEHLAFVDNIYIKEEVNMFEVITNIQTKTRFHILNAAFQQLFYAQEDSNFCLRQMCGQLRPFIMRVFDNLGQEVLTIDRPFSFSSPYACILPLNFCFLQSMTITSSRNNQVLGYIKQNYELCAPSFTLEDASGQIIGKLHAPCCICNCGNDIEFPVEKDAQENAMIVHKWGGFVKTVFTEASDYQLRFPLNMPVNHKAILLAGVFMIDFVFFEKKKDNNNNNNI